MCTVNVCSLGEGVEEDGDPAKNSRFWYRAKAFGTGYGHTELHVNLKLESKYTVSLPVVMD